MEVFGDYSSYQQTPRALVYYNNDYYKQVGCGMSSTTASPLTYYQPNHSVGDLDAVPDLQLDEDTPPAEQIEKTAENRRSDQHQDQQKQEYHEHEHEHQEHQSYTEFASGEQAFFTEGKQSPLQPHCSRHLTTNYELFFETPITEEPVSSSSKEPFTTTTTTGEYLGSQQSVTSGSTSTTGTALASSAPSLFPPIVPLEFDPQNGGIPLLPDYSVPIEMPIEVDHDYEF